LKKIVIATANKKKKKELKALLKELKVKLLSLNDLPNIPKIKEGGKTFKENAVKKAVITSEFTDKLTMADDSGLEVDALGGRPGVFSARFSGKGANDPKNNKKLLRMLRAVPSHKRKATFKCVIAMAKRGVVLKVVEGKCRGLIGFQRRGENGFGYDPVFIFPKLGKTFAELGPRAKNMISHRAKALRKAKKFIADYFRIYS